MKGKYIYLLATLLLVSCNSNTSSPNTNINTSTTSNNKNSEINSSISTSSSSSSEKELLEFNFNESPSRLVLSSKNSTNTAYSSWEASYLENGIEITTYVYDEDVFYGNIYNYGYDDNVEFLINVKNSESGWLVGGTYHFLINAEGNILFEVANTRNGLSASLDKKMGVVLGENLKYDFSSLDKEIDGFTGYYSKVYIDYKFFGTNKNDLIGNLSFCPGMRNSHNYMVNTNWSSYSERGCKWASSSTFVLINNDGTFGERLKLDLDTLYLGDTVFDKSNWDTFNNDILNEKSNNIASKNSDINYWKNEIEYYKDCTIDKVVLYLGTNDVINERELEDISKDLKSIIDLIDSYYRSVKIYYVSMIVTPSIMDYNYDMTLVNDSMKSYAQSKDNFEYIDVYNKIIINNELRRGLFESDYNLNYLGYNILADEIHKALKLAKNNLPSIFGSNDSYASSNSFEKITLNNIEYVEGTGDKDQYLFFSRNASNKFEAGVKLSAVEVYNNDNYPKFGIALVGKQDTLFFYIDGSNGLTKQNVGYVRGKNNISWQWALSMEQTVDCKYNNNNFVDLKVKYLNNKIYLYVNANQIFEVNDFFAQDELLSVSILSFNTHLLLKDYYYN